MMNHGAMLWGAALYNNGAFRIKNYRFGQAYGADGAPLRLINPRPVTPKTRGCTASCRSSIRCPRFNDQSAGKYPAHLRTGGEKQLQLGIPTIREPPGKPLRRLVRARPRHTEPHRSGFSRSCRKRGCTIRCSVSWARTIIRAIIVPAVARRATSFMRTIVRRRNSGWWSKYGHQGLSFTR